MAEELYFRAQNSKTIEERKAIKGVQHAIEDVIKRHGMETFRRPEGKRRFRDWYRQDGK